MKKCTKNILKYSVILTIFIIFFHFAFNQNLSVSKYTITNKLIPHDFDNFKIVLLSDLHYKTFGDSQQDLVDLINAQEPDLIAMTGDMIDSRKTDYSNTENLFSKLNNIAPTYCVSGNHERQTYEIQTQMTDLYKKYQIKELCNETINLYNSQGLSTQPTSYDSNEYIELCGVSYLRDDNIIDSATLPTATDNHFSLLLNHRTDNFDYFTDKNYNLILSGHTHGGIIRLPYIGGLIGNNKTLFPKYDSGLFTKNNTTLISSRGLGTTRNIPRVFNKPDVVVITLKNSTN